MKVNLDVLDSIIPFLLAAKDKFQAYYVYAEASPIDISTLAFSYFIHTRRYTLFLSNKLDRAILAESKSITECYNKICLDFIREARPLLAKIESMENLIKMFDKSLSDDVEKFIDIFDQPCLLIYFDMSLIKKYAIGGAENIDILSGIFYEYVKSAKSLFQNKHISVFTQEGLNKFIETGCLTELPSFYTKPFDVEDRIILLQYLLDDLVNDRIIFRLSNSSKFIIPRSFSVSNYSNNSLLISDYNYKFGSVNALKIEEPFIVDAFYDFFNSIPDSDLIFSKEDTVEAIQDALKRLEPNLAAGHRLP